MNSSESEMTMLLEAYGTYRDEVKEEALTVYNMLSGKEEFDVWHLTALRSSIERMQVVTELFTRAMEINKKS